MQQEANPGRPRWLFRKFIPAVLVSPATYFGIVESLFRIDLILGSDVGPNCSYVAESAVAGIISIESTKFGRSDGCGLHEDRRVRWTENHWQPARVNRSR